jgi:uncharacterized phiE125 gp8 family phage protein
MMFDSSYTPIHFGLKRTVDATTEPFTAAEAKLWLRFDASLDDSIVDALVKAARMKVEADTGRVLIDQTWALSLDKAPTSRRPIILPVAPVSAITSIKSYNAANTEATMTVGDYRLDSHSVPHRVVLNSDSASWPSDLRKEGALLVTFTAGYGANAAAVTDKGLLHAIRLLVAHWYVNRSAVDAGSGGLVVSKEIELAYEALIAQHRVPWLA